jgi:hypothetical protein
MGERREVRDGRSLAALGLAAAGVLAGHWLTYLVVRPAPTDRAALLGATGHAYLASAVEICSLSALAAAAALFIARLARGGNEDPTTPELAVRFWALQALAFAVIEIAERIASGSSAGLVPALVVGAAAQLVVAWVCAWLVRQLLEVADLVSAFAHSRPQDPARARSIRVPAGAVLPHDTPALTAAGIRGPPSGR